MSSKQSVGAKKASEDAKQLIETTRLRDIFNVLLGFRIFNAFALSTFFQPDEFYQSLEPAWALVFGKGEHAWFDGAHDGPWITWEWRNQLRSSLHPWLYAGVYKAIDLIGNFVSPAIRTKLLVHSPKVIQAVGAAAMDFYSFKLAGRVYGANSTEAWTVLGLTALSPWQWFVSTRSLSNCLETSLTVAALYYWPWEWVKGSTDSKARERDSKNLMYCVLLAGFASVLRPTNVIIWAVLSLFTLPRANQREFFSLVNAASTWGSAVLVVSMGADYLYYGEVTFPPLNFVKFNIEMDIASFYGINRLDYYFSTAIPTIMMTTLPFTINGISQCLAGRFLSLPADTKGGELHPSVLRSLAFTSMALPIALSFIRHKETRFIYPILPMLFIIIARPVITFFHPFPSPASGTRKLLLYGAIGSNVLLAIYLGSFHQRGPMEAMAWIREQHELDNPSMMYLGNTTAANQTHVGFMMPCHSVPWRSHMVYEGIRAWQLTCEPPLNGTDERSENGQLEEETELFYNDPNRWVRLEFGTQRRGWPDYIVMYDQLRAPFKGMVSPSAFELAWSGFNSVFHEDWRRQGRVNIMVKTIPYGGPGKRENPILELSEEDLNDPALKLVMEGMNDPEKMKEYNAKLKEGFLDQMHGDVAKGQQEAASANMGGNPQATA